MSITIIDKRSNNHDRSTENRQRFLKRIRSSIKEQLPKLIKGRSLKDLDSAGGKVRINTKTIREPQFHHGDGGNIDRVIPGNDRWVEHDTINKPGGGGSRGGGPGGEDMDDFVVELSRDEFLKFFFEDLELPDMLITKLAKLKESRTENAGFQPEGAPNRLSVVRSYKQSLARRIPMRKALDKQIEECELALESSTSDELRLELGATLETLKRRRDKIPMFEDIDLRYRAVIQKELPIVHATMVMIMDNSGSMGQKEKTIARKFFWLLYSFLSTEYEEVDMIFISHTDTAREMGEHDFFNTRESGGTIVSSALDLATKIIRERGLAETSNVYVAQVSDGDNYDTDNGTCSEILEDDLLPLVRYHAYVQVDAYHDIGVAEHHASVDGLLNMRGLWKSYNSVSQSNPKLQLARVFEERDIYKVFKELFAKKRAGETRKAT